MLDMLIFYFTEKKIQFVEHVDRLRNKCCVHDDSFLCDKNRNELNVTIRNLLHSCMLNFNDLARLDIYSYLQYLETLRFLGKISSPRSCNMIC